MKKINLISRLLSYSHEKQKPQRFARYAAILIMLLTLGVGQMWADNTHVIAVAGSNPNNYTVKVEANIGDGGTKWMYTFDRAGSITFEGKKLYVGYFNEKYGGVNGLDIHYYDGDDWKSKCTPYGSGWHTDLNDNKVYNEDDCSWYATKTVSVGARVYFQPDEDWTQTSNKIWVGHANYQRYYSMSRVTNTLLYYGTIVTNGWTNAMGIGVVGGTSASDGDNYFSNASSNSSEYTGLKNWDVNNTAAGNAYLIVSNGDTGETPTMSYHSSHYSASGGLNYTQTIKYAVGVNGGTPATLTSGYVPADIAINSYKFSSGTYNSVSSSSGSVTLSQGGSNYSATVTAARTATTTYTVSNVHEDYSFLGWYSAASGGTLLSSELSYTFYPTSATTAYARFSKENNHSVTISRYCTSTSTEINNTSAKIGEVTYSSIEAPDIHGYTFVNWSLGSGLTKHSSDALTANPIRVITAASGTYTLTANYTEVLTTDWKLIGDNASNSPFGDNYSYASGKAMSKKSGASATDKAYKTLDITKTGTWGFKVATASGNSYTYGWGTGDGDYITFNRSKSGNQQDVYNGEQHELKFNPDGLGEYEFEVDYTTSPCSVKVTFPTVYTVTYGKGTGGNTVSASYSSTSFNSGTNVQSGKTVRFTQTALSGYQFKEWNTKSSGSGTRLSTSTTYDRTVASTNNVYAIYDPKQYAITLNDQDATTAVSPSSVNATYKSLTLSSAITNPLKTGYTFGGWYSAVGGGGYLVINTSGALQASKEGYTDATGWTKTSAAELYAKWTQFLTLDKNGGATDGALTVVYKKTATSSHTAAARSGYTLAGYYDDPSGGNKIINADGSLVSYSASVSDYISSSGAWIYDGTPELYAHWTPKNYTITFNGGKGSRPGTVTNIQAAVTVTYDDDNFNRSGTPVATVAIPVLTGYTFGGYYTAAEGGGTQVVAANGSWIVPGSGNGNSYLDDSGNWVQANNTTLYAKWTEITHTVTLANGGHGHVEINSSTVTSVSGVGIATASGTITAVPDLGYYFTGWTGSDINNGVTIASGSTSTASITIRATADSKTITANFASIWALVGSMNSWNENTNRLGNYSTVSTKNYGYVDVDLAANTQYSFKLKDVRGDGTWYKPTSSNTEITYANKATAQGMNNTASGTPNQTIMTAGAGTYRFTWNMTDHSIVVTYPTSYTVTFGYGTGGSAVTATVEDASAITSGQYAASGKDITFTQTPVTGYTFKGWYTASSAGSAIASMASDNVYDDIAANANVYAQYNAKTYTVTLDQQSSATGYGSSGDGSLTATFDAAFPSATMPTAANGYAFMGYYSATGGGGTQFTNASGALLANIEDYSDASGHWKYDDVKTLYAYYKKAEITNLALDAATVEPKATVGVTPTISPTPTGTTIICWEVRYSNDNPLAEQPSMTWSAGKLTFAAPATSGTYKIVATLKTGNDCAGGTELSTYEANFQVAGSHTVTVQYKDASGNVIAASGSVTGKPLEWSSAIEAPEIFGYEFDHWKAGDGVTLSEDGTSALGEDESDEETIYIKAVYDGKLTAVYNQKSIIYFKNTLGWSNVYVNFMTGSYWNTDNGSGNSNSYYSRNQQMSLVPGTTDIYYHEYSCSTSKYVSFTSSSQNGAANFWAANPGVNVVYPACRGNDLADKVNDLGFYAKTPMFVPLKDQPANVKNNTGTGKANYYNDGYWTKYTEGTGYTLEIYYDYDASSCVYSIPFTSEDDLMPMTAVVDLEAGTTYRYQLKRDGDVYYGNSGTMTYADHGQSTAWNMSTEATRKSDDKSKDIFAMCKLKANAAGNYTFNLSYSGDNPEDPTPVHYCLRMEVDYPVASGDYRLLYKDDVHTLWHPSAVIPAVKDKDTVSFFVRTDQHAYLKLQKCTGLAEGAVTWTDTVTWWTNGASLPAAITKDSVYNICLKHNASNGKLEIENVEGYTGNFYIRTNAAGASKWDNYRSADHLMTYSQYSEQKADYSHYFMAYVGNGTNIKFVVANDYSPCISDTLIQQTYRDGDSYHVNAVGDIGADANVRFMWNKNNNEVYRAYLAAAKSEGSKFLVLRANSSTDLMDENGNALINSANSGEAGYNHKAPDNSMQFVDDDNWIYETTVKVKPDAYVKLYAYFNTKYFYYKGVDNNTFDKDNAIQLMTGTGSAEKLHVIYDFKTDRLMAAWMPSGNIDTEREINADVMFLREHQGDIEQLTFSENALSGKMGSITAINTAYGVLRFNKWTINNKSKEVGHSPLSPLLSRYERDLFYVSFPFRVAMNEVFGFGKYGQHWIIEYYDGEARAANGFWADTPTYWRYVTDRKGKFFEPNQGYIIALDLDELGTESDVWDNGVENVELYFPSYGTMGSITNSEVEYTLPAHAYDPAAHPGHTDDRSIKDSHWNVMSVPTYVNTSSVAFANKDWTTPHPSFLYEWNSSDNSLTPRSGSGYTYHAMHAYIVQYAGKVTWTSTSVTPAAAPNRNPDAPADVEYRLELQQNDVAVDQAFVRLSNEENVSAGFAFGEDMSKEFNKNRSNIYTFIGTEQVAGNCLPMSEQTTVVPVGVIARTTGDYTFALPEGTNGVGVTLIDNETGIRTPLSALDYTVNLTAGTYNERFVLEISPIHHMPTGIEMINDANGENGVRKLMIDGILYIVKDGIMYDAQGKRIQ